MSEQKITERLGKSIVRGIKAGVKINSGALVAQNAAGFALPAADAAGLKVLGLAAFTVDNTLGADGENQVEILQGFAVLAAAGLTMADMGKDCYVVDENTVALAAGNNGVFAGVLAEFIDENEAWVATGFVARPAFPKAAVIAAEATVDATAAPAVYAQADAETAVALANALKAKLNALLAALKAAGLMANE